MRMARREGASEDGVSGCSGQVMATWLHGTFAWHDLIEKYSLARPLAVLIRPLGGRVRGQRDPTDGSDYEWAWMATTFPINNGWP